MNRIEVLANNLPDAVDGVLISSPENRLYYTKMKSSAGTLIVTKEKNYFIVDFRYIELAKKTIENCEIILQDKLYKQIEEIATRHNIKTLGIESAYLTTKSLLTYKQNLPNVSFLENNVVTDLIVNQRKVKDKKELEILQQAQDITDKTFSYILNFIKAGKTEKEIALEMEFYSRKIGSECASFDFIVVSGANSSLPHGVPTDKILNDGDMLTMDFGAVIAGYHSDMTRTIAIGTVGEKQQEVYHTVLKAQLESIKGIKAGVLCSDVDKIARDIITNAGFGKNFGHGLGHSLGIEIHESPAFSASCSEVCVENLVMTVEPGIYLPNAFGVRIEDMVVVQENGHKNLTKSTKDLIIV